MEWLLGYIELLSLFATLGVESKNLNKSTLNYRVKNIIEMILNGTSLISVNSTDFDKWSEDYDVAKPCRRKEEPVLNALASIGVIGICYLIYIILAKPCIRLIKDLRREQTHTRNQSFNSQTTVVPNLEEERESAQGVENLAESSNPTDDDNSPPPYSEALSKSLPVSNENKSYSCEVPPTYFSLQSEGKTDQPQMIQRSSA